MIGTGKYRQIVDENDNLIGYKSKEDFNPSEDIYRVSALWLRNSDGGVLLAQRAFKKKNGGGLWGPAVAGTVENDETYEDNIVKEIEEEIGLKGLVLERGNKYFIETDDRKYFCVYFYALCDKRAIDFELEDEVEAVKWVTEDWLLNDIQLHPELYVQGMANNIQSIMNDCRGYGGGKYEKG